LQKNNTLYDEDLCDIIFVTN